MPNNFSVDVVETDEFGWDPKLEETKFFAFLEDANRFVNTYNKNPPPGRRPGFYFVARIPKETAPPTTMPPNIISSKQGKLIAELVGYLNKHG